MIRTRERRTKCARAAVVVAALVGAAVARPLPAQDAPRTIELTLDRAVEIAMDDSYRVRQLRLQIERTRNLLRAERAGLRTNITMDFATPQFESISDRKWNSELRRDELVHENSRLWELDFSIEQPVVLFGYPTNGYLSLNNRVYRYSQLGTEEGHDVSYYNRYFIQYEQPLFQPNELRNDLEEAELDLAEAELDFQDDAVDILDNVADDFFDLYEIAYRRGVYEAHLTNLEGAVAVARELAAADSSRAFAVDQVQVALANARLQLQQSSSDYRLSASRMKQSLRLPESDSISVDPVLAITPVAVDVEQAVQFGFSLRPQIRGLEIQRRLDEIDLENTRGEDSFRMNLEFTYGREMEEAQFGGIFKNPSNSYTVGVTGRIPIWDSGARRARVQAQELNVQATELAIEETRNEIQVDIQNVVRNLEEFEQRALSMRDNLELASQVSATSLQQFRAGGITMPDLLQAFERQVDTADNFLEAYLGYREAMLELQRLTYFDFETGAPLLERFGIAGGEPAR